MAWELQAWQDVFSHLDRLATVGDQESIADMPTMRSLFVGLPNETLVQICHSLHSIQEVHHLGLTCKRLYGVLSGIGYHHLCRFLLCARTRKIDRFNFEKSNRGELSRMGYRTHCNSPLQRLLIERHIIPT